VALYVRLSPRPDGTYEGVDRQEAWGRAYAGQRWPGLPIIVFPDTGLSAGGDDHRPGFATLQEAIASGHIAHVWAVEQTRLERTELGWFGFAAIMLAAGLDEVHTDRDGIVRLDEVGGIKAVIAAAELRRLKRRVNDTLTDLAAQGRPGGGHHVAYRHTVDDQGRAALVPVPEIADAVRWAAEHVLAGWSLSAIAAEMERRGIPTAHGGRWSHNNVKGMLIAPMVAGMRVHRGQVIRTGNWEPVLDEPTWRQLRVLLDRPRRSMNAKYLLSGVAHCGRDGCGSHLTGRHQHRRGERIPIYFCAPTVGGCSRLGVNAIPLDEHVRDELLAELDRRAAFHDALAEDLADSRRRSITNALADLDRQDVELARLWARKQRSAAAWSAALDELDAERSRLTAELAALPPAVVKMDPGELREDWDAMTIEERRHIVRQYITRIVVAPAVRGRKWFDPDRVTIEWR
jgi:site-specific DNA recombinase